jgi:hypothetical protein
MATTPIPSMTGGAGGSAGPSAATSKSGFDSSGWQVNYGSGSIDSGNQKLLMYAALAVGAFLLWKQYKKRG